MTTERRLLLGSLRADGSVDPTPLVAEITPEGKVLSAEPLGAYETPSTIPLRALLAPDNSLKFPE